MRQWWLGLVVGAFIGGATGAGVAALVQPRATVAALAEQSRQYIHELLVDRLQLLDASGQGRGLLEVGDNGAALTLYDPTGRQRVGLYASGSESTLQLHDPEALTEPPGRRLVRLGVIDRGPFVTVVDRQNGTAELGVSPRIGAEVYLWGQNNQIIWSAP